MLIAFISSNSFNGMLKFSIEVMLLIITAFFIGIICKKPYFNKFNNFGLLFNLLIAIMFGGWMIARFYFPFITEQ